MAGRGPDVWESQAQGQGRQGYRRDRGQGDGYGRGYGGGRRRNDDRCRGEGCQFPQAARNPCEVRLLQNLQPIAECEDPPSEPAADRRV